MSTVTTKYTGADIIVLEGLEPVRKRPSMYIGGTDKKGLHHLVWEIVDNSVDEYLNGHADSVTVTLHKSGDAVTVGDNGRGIPVDLHPKHKKPTLELILTTLHSGAKFGEGDSYIHSGGLHGVGSSVVNALSKKLRATVRRDGFEWQQEFVRGKVKAPLEKLGAFRGHGTLIYFEPDPEIFKNTQLDAEWIKSRLDDMAYIHSGLKITFKNEITGETVDLSHPGGIPEFLGRLVTEGAKAAVTEQPFSVAKNNGEKVEVALQWTESTDETLRSYVNGIRTAAGGTHESGLKNGIAKAIRNYIKTHEVNVKGLEITAEDIREGIVGVLSVFVRNPMFQGQTKEKLNNEELLPAVDNFVRPALETWLNNNMTAADQIISRIVLAARARLASREAATEVKRKTLTNRRLNLPGKLADCKSTDLDESELFIVEGDSAGGCFSADTRVALADGRDLAFREIVAEQEAGVEHFCYTIRNDGQVGLAPFLHARVTRRSAEVIRLTLDNRETIVCTPDHQFMLRDGSYRRAEQLTPEDSLQPLNRKLSDMAEPGITIQGYEMVWDPRSDRWLFTHILADWHNRWQGVYSQDAGDHCHHVDFNKQNNNPSNIQRLSKEEHLALHLRHLDQTLHRPDVVQKCRELRQTEEFRARMSARMKEPATRQILSDQAKAQWEDETYKEYMIHCWRACYETNEEYREKNLEQLYRAQKEYWGDETHREAQSERVREYFEMHPEAKALLSVLAKEQWQDEELRDWRRQKTREQWTPEFRAKRRAALDRTYYLKTITTLRQFLRPEGTLDLVAYRAHRIATRDKSLLRFETFCQRYFDNQEKLAAEAVRNHNHRIVGVERVTEHVDVYDAEVPGTHNFALASGVFVHNSAKQGREARFQAVLPLRGKILNSEGLALTKVLANQELKDLVTALGTGAGDKFDISGLRYGKIILMMDADADGHHISTLLLDFLFRHMTELIRKGHVYIAKPPLFKISVGKETLWAMSDRHKDQILADLAARRKGKAEVGRFKGLGEMDAKELGATTMHAKTRTLMRVTIDSNLEADKVFVELLGSDPASRRKFVMDPEIKLSLEELDV